MDSYLVAVLAEVRVGTGGRLRLRGGATLLLILLGTVRLAGGATRPFEGGALGAQGHVQVQADSKSYYSDDIKFRYLNSFNLLIEMASGIGLGDESNFNFNLGFWHPMIIKMK